MGVLGVEGVIEGSLGDVFCELGLEDAFGRLLVMSDGEIRYVLRTLTLSIGKFDGVHDLTLRVDARRRIA